MLSEFSAQVSEEGTGVAPVLSGLRVDLRLQTKQIPMYSSAFAFLCPILMPLHKIFNCLELPVFWDCILLFKNNLILEFGNTVLSTL